MLAGLLLENFKAFGKRQFIPFAPITLIFGTNSAGKSSIIQALTLLKQSIDDVHSGASIVTRGSLADLGNFYDLVYQHETSRRIEITPFLDLKEKEWFLAAIPEEVGDLAAVGATFSYDRDSRAIGVSAVPVYLNDHYAPAYTMSARRSDSDDKPRTRESIPLDITEVTADHPVWAAIYERVVSASIAEAREDLVKATNLVDSRGRGLRERLRRHRPVVDRLNLLRAGAGLVDDGDSDAINDQDEYLSIWREYASRFGEYSFEQFLEDISKFSNSKNNRLRGFLPYQDVSRPSPLLQLFRELGRERAWIPDLSRIAAALATELRRELTDAEYIGPIRQLPERLYTASGVAASSVGKSGQWLPDVLYRREHLVNDTNDCLDRFDVPYRMEIEPLGVDVEDVFRLRLEDKRTQTQVSLLDVGFGVSQVLPVIVQSMFSKNEVIVIEQPEIHVHPKLQAELGSLFQICSTEPYNNQFVVETHSEHIVRRIIRLVRTKQLPHEHVCIIYVTRDAEGSVAHHLEMDEDGDFLDVWPEGFFEEAFKEIVW